MLNDHHGEHKKVAIRWTKPGVVALLAEVNEGKKEVYEVATALGTKPYYVEVRAGWLKLYGSAAEPDYKKTKKAEFGLSPSEVMLEHKDTQTINWAEFFGLDRPESFDLRRIAAMYYASEQIISASKIPSRLLGIKRKSEEFVAIWAERFGKYLLAACIGEFRNRRVAGDLRLPKKPRDSREKAQRRAQIVWGDTEKVKIVASYMVDKFSDSAFFPRSGFGGHKWSKIAVTFFDWYEKRIPDLVFVEYCWDLQHNGRMLFNKCPLFTNEHAVRLLMDKKVATRKGGVSKWGAEFLHPDWQTALDILEFDFEKEA